MSNPPNPNWARQIGEALSAAFGGLMAGEGQPPPVPSPPPAPGIKSGPYATKLSEQEEKEFQRWAKASNAPDTVDYDMRGFWKGMVSGDPVAVRSGQTGHFPDKWKTPVHKTFSSDSIYATPEAPHWVGDRLINSKGQLVADETVKKP